MHLENNFKRHSQLSEAPTNNVDVTVAPDSVVRFTISVRLSHLERRAIQSAADIEGELVTVWMRRAALHAAGVAASKRRGRRDVLATKIDKVIGLLGRYASSANQIARLGNSGQLRQSEISHGLQRFNTQIDEVKKALLIMDEAGNE